MKTTLSFGLIVAAASTLLACSDEEGTPRNNGGAGPTAGSGGQTANAGSGGQTANAGSAGQASGGNGGTGPSVNLGPALVISANGDVVDEMGNTGIDGNVFLSQSSVMETAAVTAHEDGKLCMSGVTAVVPDGSSYGTHWGAEIGLNLKTAPPPGTVVSDAGADAGAVEEVPVPWPYDNVIGFSFKVEGQDTSATTGLPANFRFKGLPEGSDSALDTFCNQVSLTPGAVQNILFEDITFQCWAMGNSTLAEDEIQQQTSEGPPPVIATRPNPKALQSLSWQVPGELLLSFPFNFCITDLRPILAP